MEDKKGLIVMIEDVFDRKFDEKLDGRLARIEEKLDSMDKRLIRVEGKMDIHFEQIGVLSERVTLHDEALKRHKLLPRFA